MATLTIELPDELMRELNHRQTSNRMIQALVEESLRTWLHKTTNSAEGTEQPAASPFNESAFNESAFPFVEQLIDENFSLFERLSKL